MSQLPDLSHLTQPPPPRVESKATQRDSHRFFIYVFFNADFSNTWSSMKPFHMENSQKFWNCVRISAEMNLLFKCPAVPNKKNGEHTQGMSYALFSRCFIQRQRKNTLAEQNSLAHWLQLFLGAAWRNRWWIVGVSKLPVFSQPHVRKVLCGKPW